MKYMLTVLFLWLTNFMFAQPDFPDFLEGTWRVENKKSYEHWNRIDDDSLKGFSYRIEDGQLVVSEYLDIFRKGREIIYTALVLNQNQRKGISFKLTKTNDMFIFENPDHDFPKKIIYQLLTDTEILVKISDGNKKEYAYKMEKTVTNP